MQIKSANIERIFWVTGWIYDFSRLATTLLLVGLVVHYFFFTILVVKGRSMDPTYHDGQVLIINKVAYLTGQPQRGDVVAMFFPGETEKRFIKRVVGLPGEKVTIKAGHVLINDHQLPEKYLAANVTTTPDLERILQPTEYFVLGDNRGVSSDSRAWGTVPRSFLIGRIASEN